MPHGRSVPGTIGLSFFPSGNRQGSCAAFSGPFPPFFEVQSWVFGEVSVTRLALHFCRWLFLGSALSSVKTLSCPSFFLPPHLYSPPVRPLYGKEFNNHLLCSLSFIFFFYFSSFHSFDALNQARFVDVHVPPAPVSQARHGPSCLLLSSAAVSRSVRFPFWVKDVMVPVLLSALPPPPSEGRLFFSGAFLPGTFSFPLPAGGP